MAKARRPQRGEIWMVHFDPSVGAEIRKVRPAVVVSVDTIGLLERARLVDRNASAPAVIPWAFLPYSGT